MPKLGQNPVANPTLPAIDSRDTDKNEGHCMITMVLPQGFEYIWQVGYGLPGCRQ